MSVSSINLSSSTASIAVFDSGVGGLSILDKVHQLLPGENLLYFADSAYAPYGPKSEELIQQRCQAAMEFFIKSEVKALVLACNTATAAAVALLRDTYTLPIIGMEPAIKPAAEQSRSGVVGVLATAGTIDSDKFVDLKTQHSEKVEIITKACPGLVEQIEQLRPDRVAIKRMLEEFTRPLIDKGIDTLVLGCTHYSLIRDLIKEVVGNDITIMDTGFAVANELQRRLHEEHLENTGNISEVRFYSTGKVDKQQGLLSLYWGSSVKLTQANF